MNSLSRRAFLEKVSVVAVGGIALNGAPAAFGVVRPAQSAAPGPHISFPTAPRDRISVASYPFRAYIDAPNNRNRDSKLPGMDLTDFPAEVVKRFNVHHIEPHNRHFRSTDPAYLASFREALAKAEVGVANVVVDGRGSFYDPDPVTRETAVTAAKSWVDVAATIGSPSIRTHIQGSRNSAPNADLAAESLQKLAGYGAENNVVVNLENDDPITEDAFFIVKVIERVNHPYLHALPDFANSMLKGDANFNYRALQAMFQHAYCICHVKDGETDDHGNLVTVDLKKSFGILKASGYRGFCSMEYDATGDPYAPTAKLIEQTIQYLS
ncbi:MAG TPA: sugar phosphate isomerase/epimerase family protein [Candidatus Acidoferrum sp.]|jgi:sugar phosphate isomerase/epimerase|nr:sugar phosphate isomerase/epimerase family protein [Candidatus Acidoferrum sp.]